MIHKHKEGVPIKLFKQMLMKEYKMSIIEWRTGVPKEEGCYLVTIQTSNGNEVTYISFEEYGWFGNGDCRVIAWCPLSEIEPYKE